MYNNNKRELKILEELQKYFSNVKIANKNTSSIQHLSHLKCISMWDAETHFIRNFC